jgi:hypothetical protein
MIELLQLLGSLLLGVAAFTGASILVLLIASFWHTVWVETRNWLRRH